MMVLRTCPACSLRFYAPRSAGQRFCWRCERLARQSVQDVAERLLAQVFPHGLPADR